MNLPDEMVRRLISSDETVKKLKSERDRLKYERDQLRTKVSRLLEFRCVGHGGEIRSIQSGPCAVCNMPTTGRPVHDD